MQILRDFLCQIAFPSYFWPDRCFLRILKVGRDRPAGQNRAKKFRRNFSRCFRFAPCFSPVYVGTIFEKLKGVGPSIKLPVRFTKAASLGFGAEQEKSPDKLRASQPAILSGPAPPAGASPPMNANQYTSSTNICQDGGRCGQCEYRRRFEPGIRACFTQRLSSDSIGAYDPQTSCGAALSEKAFIPH